MTSSTTTCSIQLLNNVHEIKCPQDEVENLQQAGVRLNEQLLLNKKKFKDLDPFQTLMLAALTLTHELLACQKKQEQQRHQVTEFISSLENKINQVVHGNPQFDPQTD